MAKRIKACAKPQKIIALSVPVTITAESEEDEKKMPATFNVTAYNGGALNLNGWDLPVVIDLAGLQFARNVIANLDHDSGKRVGHVTEKAKADGKVQLSGVFSAATQHRAEVVDSAKAGWPWEASVEVYPSKVVEVAAGKTVEVNGQTFSGPLYVTRKGTLSAFAFVSHGADQNTSVNIAAEAAFSKEQEMEPKIKAWAESMGIDVDSLSDEQKATIEANYNGLNGKKLAKQTVSNPFEARKLEAKRRQEIRDVADKFIERNPHDFEFISAIEKMHDHAIEAEMSVQDFRNEMYESTIPVAHTVPAPRNRQQADSKVIEAAICMTGRLPGHEKMFDDRTLQAAHDQFRNGIGLKQLFLLAAESNGYRGNYSSDVTVEVQQFAFAKQWRALGMAGPQIKAQTWSTLDIQTILSNTANKFLRVGWDSVDMTPLRIAYIKSVRNFLAHTTVSLTGDLMFEELGAAGEIKHGKLGEVSYSDKADTYAKMLAITRQDIINDDIGALTEVPRRLGRGSALKLNDIFWTAFLAGESAGFFSASHTNPTGNSNLNTAAADVTLAGLTATEVMFLNQIDPDGKPLGVMPEIVLVPTAQKANMVSLLDPQSRLIDGTGTAARSDANPFRGRFRVESSPYMHNSSYTGYSTSAWYMLADPNVLPAITIAALNGRVEPTIETADAEFSVLGVQMRGFSDVGVARTEYRAAVKADGGSS